MMKLRYTPGPDPRCMALYGVGRVEIDAAGRRSGEREGLACGEQPLRRVNHGQVAFER